MADAAIALRITADGAANAVRSMQTVADSMKGVAAASGKVSQALQMLQGGALVAFASRIANQFAQAQKSTIALQAEIEKLSGVKLGFVDDLARFNSEAKEILKDAVGSDGVAGVLYGALPDVFKDFALALNEMGAGDADSRAMLDAFKDVAIQRARIIESEKKLEESKKARADREKAALEEAKRVAEMNADFEAARGNIARERATTAAEIMASRLRDMAGRTAFGPSSQFSAGLSATDVSAAAAIARWRAGGEKTAEQKQIDLAQRQLAEVEKLAPLIEKWGVPIEVFF